MSRRAYVTPENAPDSFQCRELFVPTGQSWEAIVTGALSSLADPGHYEQVTGLTPEQTAAILELMLSAWDAGKGCPMFASMIVPMGRDTAPDGWLMCDGEAYLIEQYPALYNAIGVTFGDDGAGTFRVPDLRGRKPIGAGQGAGLTERVLGTTGGEESHQLTTDELAAHVHETHFAQDPTLPKRGTGSNIFNYWPNYGPADPGTMGDTTSIGGDQAHNNVDPWLALNFAIYAGQ